MPTRPHPFVHVYFFQYSAFCQDSFDKSFALLQPSERKRAEQFKVLPSKQAFVSCRAFLKSILSQWYAKPPLAITLSYNAHGKPSYSETGTQELFFNVSHCDQWGSLAISNIAPIGLDIESTTRKLEYLELTERFFHPQEYATLKQAPQPLQAQHFFQLWTAKEAYVKALGKGLAHELKHFHLAPKGPGQFYQEETAETAPITLCTLPTPQNTAGSLALQTKKRPSCCLTTLSEADWLNVILTATQQ